MRLLFTALPNVRHEAAMKQEFDKHLTASVSRQTIHILL